MEEKEDIEEVLDATINFTMGLIKRLFSDKDVPKLAARFAKRYYDALIKEGFTKQEALEIVTRMQYPTLPSRI
jgi:hypothetical protein